MIQHSKPTVSEDDALRVAAVVRSGHLVQGAEVEGFERELAGRPPVASAAAVSSGSAALPLALSALGAALALSVVR